MGTSYFKLVMEILLFSMLTMNENFDPKMLFWLWWVVYQFWLGGNLFSGGTILIVYFLASFSCFVKWSLLLLLFELLILRVPKLFSMYYCALTKKFNLIHKCWLTYYWLWICCFYVLVLKSYFLCLLKRNNVCFYFYVIASGMSSGCESAEYSWYCVVEIFWIPVLIYQSFEILYMGFSSVFEVEVLITLILLLLFRTTVLNLVQ